MATTPQQAYDVQRAREKAKTQGHAARRSIDATNRKAGRKEARKEIAQQRKFDSGLPFFGAWNPDTEQYQFRPGAAKGWWENRSEDWIGTQRDAAEGQSSWTKVQPASVARRPNGGFGYTSRLIAGTAAGLFGGKQSSGTPGTPLPPPVMPPGGLPKAAPAGGGAVPQQQGPQQQGPKHMWPTVTSNRTALPTGKATQPTGPTSIPAAQAAAVAAGATGRQPGQKRVLTGQATRGALGTGSPAIGRGKVIDTTARSVPSNTGGKALKGGTGTYMENEYGDSGDEGEHMGWARSAEKRIAFAVDPANKIPRVDTRLAGSNQYEQQKTRYNAAWAKTGTDMPSVYGDD